MTRAALVTGGTSGIGAATARALAKAGYRVGVTYASDRDRARAFADETGLDTFCWDASDAEACEKGVAEAEMALGPIDILINNAGITCDASFMKMTPEIWQRVIDVDLGSCFAMSKAVWPGMVARGWGRIVNISSVNGQSGQFGQANYSAAKAGILGFTKALALEGARYGITVNAIAPGYIDTEMVHAVPAKVVEALLGRIPVRRLGQPEEIARCAMFLAAEDAGYITGSTLSVNGGLRMD